MLYIANQSVFCMMEVPFGHLSIVDWKQFVNERRPRDV